MRDCPGRGVADLAALPLRSAGRRGGLQEGARHRGRPPAPRAFRRGRHPIRFQRSPDRLADGYDWRRAGQAQAVMCCETEPRVLEETRATSADTTVPATRAAATREIAPYSMIRGGWYRSLT